jgi:hypothetical protein
MLLAKDRLWWMIRIIEVVGVAKLAVVHHIDGVEWSRRGGFRAAPCFFGTREICSAARTDTLPR